MKTRLIFCLTFLLQLVFQQITAQIPVGSWRDHFSYNQVRTIAKAGNKMYCATPHALFYYNLNDYSVEKLSRTNGLSDMGISTISYHPEKDVLMVAYQNANIDLIEGNNIYNLKDIKNKQIQGNKKIYQIVFQGNLAYLACGFGIVVIDLDKREVKDTYYIGPNASSIEVYSIVFDDNYIYGATESGIYFASKDNPNLANYNEWQITNSIDFPNGKYTSIIKFNSTLYANYLNTSSNTSIIYKQTGTSWNAFYNDGKLITKLNESNNFFFIIEEKAVKIFNTNLIEERQISDYGFSTAEPLDACMDTDGTLYIGDKFYGMVINKNTSEYQSVSPNGPFSNDVVDIDIQNSKVWVAGGGRNSFWGNLYNFCMAYSFMDQAWASNILWSSKAYDFVKILVNPSNPSQVFAASWGAGLFEFSNFDLVQNYNAQNSSLQSILVGEDFIRIGGLFLDQSQNLYMTNTGVSSPISVKTFDGHWYSYNYPGITGYPTIGEIIETQSGDKWVQLAKGGGLFAFNDNYTPSNMDDDDSRRFSLYDETGQVVTNEIFSLAVDEDNVVWVGTDQGVFTYNNPQNVFTNQNFYADRIKVVDSKTDTVIQFLLGKEKITAIEIDGANRKWFGTENSGAFLMSADCQIEIFHFTTDNSKLISNQITTIGIDGKTGEVFLGTNIGMVSFKGTATKGNDSYSDAYIYPNPVRENYDGPITITGLASNVNVKVTDISGQIVYETNSFGGQAIWDGNNFSGKRVSTGIYLVFCTDENGEHKKVLKLLVIN